MKAFIEGWRRHNLPQEYSSFRSLPDRQRRFTTDISSTREQERFAQAYNNAWIALCMTIDVRAQQQAHTTARTTVLQIDPALDLSQKVKQRREINDQYWQTLSEQSVYRRYTAVAESFREQEYGANIVSNWNSPRIPGAMRYITQHAEQIYPYIYNRDLITDSFADTGIGGHNRTLLKEIENLHTEAGGESPITDLSLLIGYVTAFKLRQAARNRLFSVLTKQIQQFDQVNRGELTVSIPNWDEYFTHLLRRVEPYRYFSEAITGAMSEQEGILFREDTELASTLWKTVISMRIDEAQKLGYVTEVRRPLLNHLIRGEYQEARFLIEELMAQEPNLFAPFVPQYLGIDPDTLRKLYREANANEEESPKAIADRLAVWNGRSLWNPDTLFGLRLQRVKNSNTFVLADVSPEIQEIIGTGVKTISAKDLDALITLFGLELFV